MTTALSTSPNPSHKAKSPSHLGSAGKAYFRAIVAEWSLNEPQTKLLTLLCEAIDTQHQARETLKAQGLTVTTEKGSLKPHPAVQVERNASRMIASLTRQLDFRDEAKPSKPARVNRAPRKGA